MGATRSRIEIDLEAVSRNVQITRDAVGPDTLILAVVKKNAYGHGLEQTARAVVEAGADRLGVADSIETERLRNAGIICPIHVLGPPLPEEMDICLKNDVIITVPDIHTAKAANDAACRAGSRMKCHLIVDTGMGRLGPEPRDALGLAREVSSLKGMDIEGAFTHFPNSNDPSLCRKQYEAFVNCIEEIKSSGIDVPVLHAAACGTIFSMPELHLDMVRPGLCLLGVYNYCGMKESVNLHPVMKIITTIAAVKTVPPGTPVSYSGTYITKKETRVATVPFGYGNGYDFRLSNKGWMSVCGRKAPVLGRVTMDYTMIDVTDIPEAAPGTEAVVLGSPGPDAEELAGMAGTVPHEVLCSLGRTPE